MMFLASLRNPQSTPGAREASGGVLQLCPCRPGVSAHNPKTGGGGGGEILQGKIPLRRRRGLHMTAVNTEQMHYHSHLLLVLISF
jgi:hypothetical protein